MSMYRYEEAFGAADTTTKAMGQAQAAWREAYYDGEATGSSDPCQRIAYTVVNKILRAMFGEYKATCEDAVADRYSQALEKQRLNAVQMMLMGGECYIKPYPKAEGFDFTLVPRENLMVFGRDSRGVPVDVGMVELSVRDKFYYTLLERRYLDEAGCLTVENTLYRATNRDSLGTKVSLQSHPDYAHLVEKFTLPQPLGGVGLVQMKTPMRNCVDGSPDGVAVYAPAMGLIRNINENEAQLVGEFHRGESRILASGDLLSRGEGLKDHLFVGLDADPEQVGLTIFSPQLREESFLARKQEYLRNVESIIGLRRGMLSDANVEDRTATEITSSAGDFNLTVIDFQKVWEQALEETVALCAKLAGLYGLAVPKSTAVFVDWGNGVLYDEDKTWLDYRNMVAEGMLAPEIALGWRFQMPTDTPQQRAAIRARFMPATQEKAPE